MKIKKTFRGLFHKLFYRKDKLISTLINEKNLRTINGTIKIKKELDTDWFLLLAKNSEIIFDVGCNIGQTAILGLTCENVKKIILIDPNSEALIKANKNLIYNNFIHKTSSYLAFVSNENDKELDFYSIGSASAGSMFKSHSETAASVGSHYKVNTVTLDYLSDYFKLIPDFIKIDVEGAESLVLEGAITIAKNNEIKILIEMHSNKELSMIENTERVLTWCKKTNYEAWYLKDNSKLVNNEQLKNRGRCHLILLPKSVDFDYFLNKL